MTIKLIAIEMELNIDIVRWITKLQFMEMKYLSHKRIKATPLHLNKIIKEYLLGISKKALAVKYNFLNA